jgi:hypothetical protein
LFGELFIDVCDFGDGDEIVDDECVNLKIGLKVKVWYVGEFCEVSRV